MEIEIYESKGGKCDIKEKLQEMDARDARKIRAAIKKLQVYDFMKLLKSETVKKLEDNLYELRPHGYRIIFTQKRERYFLLTLFKKQGNKTPLKELKKARQLKKLIL